MRVERLFTYPVKALRAVELDAAEVTAHGFRYDRRFMLMKVSRGPKEQGDSSTDDETKEIYAALDIGKVPQAVHFQPRLEIPTDDEQQGQIIVTYTPPPPSSPAESGHASDLQDVRSSKATLTIPLFPDTQSLKKIEVAMWESSTTAYVMPSEYSEWFSARLDIPVIFVYIGANLRAVHMSTGLDKNDSLSSAKTWSSKLLNLAGNAMEMLPGSASTTKPDKACLTFSDIAPYHIVSSRSLDDVHHRLEGGARVDIIKFRPNVVVGDADEPWEEDYWGELTITSSTPSADPPLQFSCPHNVGRCRSLNINYLTGECGTGPTGAVLKALTRDRRVDPGMKYSPVFGRYAFVPVEGEGLTIRVGDKVKVSRRNDERSVFDWRGLSTAEAPK